LRSTLFAVFVLSLAALGLLFAQNHQNSVESNQLQLRHVSLPTSKILIGPSPGVVGALNGFTPTVALSPDRRYAALLNDGYGSQSNGAHQSIAILNSTTNHLADFPDERLGEDARQSYFVGLAFSSDGNHLYASMGSITDSTGEKPGDTGNGIAVYSFRDGKLSPERFIKIPPQKIAKGKEVAYGLRKTPSGTAIPYPAGLAVIPARDGNADKLLIANNYSDNILLVDSASGRILKSIDVSEHQLIPSEFPHTCVASHDGARAWCSLWNASKVVMLDLESGKIVRSIPLQPPAKPADPGSHPTALLLSPDEKELFVTISNADRVAVVDIASGLERSLSTNLSGNSPGSCPDALALSADGSRLFAAAACLDAVAVFDLSKRPISVNLQPMGFIPTDWYPTALATMGDDLLIATSKGQGTGPNNFPGKTGYERRHRENAYIPTLLYGSIARLNIDEIEMQLPEFTKRVEQSNRVNLDPANIQFVQGSNPIKHVIYILKENRTYDQVLGDLKVGNGDPSLTLYGADVTPNERTAIRSARQFL
jgi:DNA-binding beta-propeller fold protein YncE